MKKVLNILFTLLVFNAYSQEIYVVGNESNLSVINTSDFSTTPLFALDLFEFGYLTDIAFSPSGTLYGVTNGWQLLEIDLVNETAIVIKDLPPGDSYTSLYCTAENQLITAKLLSGQLFTYDLNTDVITVTGSGFNTPGDATYYKGNLIFPYSQGTGIRAFDGTSFKNVGCTGPLVFTYVNQFLDCNDNTIFGIDEDGVIYEYFIETNLFEEVANVFDSLGRINGGATITEYQASACPQTTLNPVNCSLGIGINKNLLFSVYPNPAKSELYINNPNNAQLSSFSIVSLEGKTTQTSTITFNETINVSNLKSGLYFLNLLDEKNVLIETHKIIIE